MTGLGQAPGTARPSPDPATTRRCPAGRVDRDGADPLEQRRPGGPAPRDGRLRRSSTRSPGPATRARSSASAFPRARRCSEALPRVASAWPRSTCRSPPRSTDRRAMRWPSAASGCASFATAVARCCGRPRHLARPRAWAGRASEPGTPAMTDAGWAGVWSGPHPATEVVAAGRRLAFHPHAGTFIETPAEVDRLVAASTRDVSGSASTSATTRSAAATRSRRSRDLGDA